MNIWGTDQGGVVSTSSLNNMGTIYFKSGIAKITGSYIQSQGSTVIENEATLEPSVKVDIQAGSLSGAGKVKSDLSMAGQLTPGSSAGILSVEGNYTQTATGSFTAELGGTTAGSGYDQLKITGSANLNGTLNISLIPPFIPASGDNFQIMTFGSRTGDFSAKNGLDALGVMKLTAEYSAGSLDLKNSQLECTLSPASDKKSVGKEHEILFVLTEDDNPVAGETVTFSVNQGPNSGVTLEKTSDASGQAVFKYQGSGGDGIDSITATGTVVERLFSCSASMEWVDLQGFISPATAKKVPSEEHTVVAEILQGGFAAPDLTVSFTVLTGPNAGTGGSVITDGLGQASFSYSGNGQEGVDTIKYEATISGFTVSGSSTVEWKRRQISLSVIKAGLSGDDLVSSTTTLEIGDPVSFTLLVGNQGQDVAEDIKVWDFWPQELEFLEATTSHGSCAMSQTIKTLECSLGDISGGSEVSITITSKVLTPGEVINRAEILYDDTDQYDPDLQDNSSSVTFQVSKKEIDLSLLMKLTAGSTVISNNGVVFVGENLSFSLDLRNGGPDESGMITVSDVLGQGLNFVSVVSEPGTCQYLDSTRTVSCQISSLAPGGSASITIAASADAEGSYLNLAGSDFDDNLYLDNQLGNNGASVSFKVVNKINGDANGNGKIDLEDLVMGMEVLSGKKVTQGRTAVLDINGDGQLLIDDLLYLMQFLAGLR